MIWLYIVLFLVTLTSFRFTQYGLVKDFTGKKTANVVKGIFIWMVFISHIQQYIKTIYPESLGYAFTHVASFWGQMIVVSFLFYSGYGVLININRKGYVTSIPKRRILTVLLNFDVAVILYILLDLLIGESITTNQCILSLFAWDSVGNSNWYIFAIIVMYLFSYIAGSLFGSSTKYLICLILLTLLYIGIMSLLKQSWWYNTILAYPFGAVYGYYKKQFDNYLQRRYFIKLFIVLFVFMSLYVAPDPLGLTTNIRALFLCILILMFTMRVPLKNKFLAWSGKNLFPIYIYQRMPMLIFSTLTVGGFTLLNYNLLLYILVCFSVTILITMLHRYFAIKL